MSIRLRLTLLYSAILSLTLVAFGIALYLIQAQFTLDSLKNDLHRSGQMVAQSTLWRYEHPEAQDQFQPGGRPPDPPPGETFKDLREREIVRVLDAQGALVASPPGASENSLPISSEGLQAVQAGREWWQIVTRDGEPLLVYNRPVNAGDQVIYIVQAARSLAERNRSLASLSRTLAIAGALTALTAFGIGWALSGTALHPIHRITQTAQAIGSASDLTRRVDYTGPADEVGELATTFNAMLDRLQDAYQRVSYSLKMQRDFVADVSHELRTPLTTVRGNLALLRRKPPLPMAEQSDILADLVEESDRLIRLVNDLLVLARADAGRNLLQESLALRPLIEEACRQARLLAPQRQINEAAVEMCVLGDRDALKQVLLILLDNALKHTHGPIQVSGEAVGEEALIRVSDEGPGMSPEALAHVFDRFYRGENAPGAPGFGLGLSIAKALVEGQGGRIAIESQPESGSVVRLYLPQATSRLP